ncbi:RNA polymerase sigma-70 factor [Mucilaginibacter sp. Bleaf8]|uniref:RNA polymerase sigma factor n=1 Tax=Mucilaginibacter sp. Bleaf8 TaxID=2834430 RepID=UPI001BD03707|nr:RNA polymerase sigma-70 factor [Mucilaginibacter sp. Bleaf8]MBS7564102.1 RNA polymerase sigma-70 factor [Mucilaginibacter sp. Bleaf8]
MLVDEAAVVARLQCGDVNAFRQIYDYYHGKLFYYVLRFIKVPELAEDVIHDVFLKLWEIREQVKPELSLTGYLYRISRNQVFKLLKQIATQTELQNQIIHIISESITEAESGLQWQEYSVLLQQAINKLPPQRQRVFKLCRQEGKTYEETAALLGISRYTVKEHMVLAMKSIKDYLHHNTDIVFTLIIVEGVHIGHLLETVHTSLHARL